MKNERCLATFDCDLFTDRLEEIVRNEYGEGYCNKFAVYNLFELEDELIRSIESGYYKEKKVAIEDKMEFSLSSSKIGNGISYDIFICIKKDKTEEKHIILRGLTIKDRSKRVKFSINNKIILRKHNWLDEEWRAFEKLFKFSSADEIVLQPLVVTGYGNPEKGVINNEK